MMPNFAGIEKFSAHMTFNASDSAGLFLSQVILHALNPKRKIPRAERRVSVERRGQQGEQYIDATTGAIPSNWDFRASLPARLRP
jgi:hypothetical protein